MYKQVLSIFVFILYLTGCSAGALSEEAANHYKKESPLGVEIVVPEPIVLNKPQLFKVILKQNDEVVDGASNVQVSIWKKGNPTSNDSIEASNVGNGEYTVEKIFNAEGLYYVKVQASANGSTVMPTKQFIVGSLSKEELNELQRNLPKEKPTHKGHH